MKTEQETGNKNSRKCDSVELKSLDGLADMWELRVCNIFSYTKARKNTGLSKVVSIFSSEIAKCCTATFAMLDDFSLLLYGFLPKLNQYVSENHYRVIRNSCQHHKCPLFISLWITCGEVENGILIN